MDKWSKISSLALACLFVAAVLRSLLEPAFITDIWKDNHWQSVERALATALSRGDNSPRHLASLNLQAGKLDDALPILLEHWQSLRENNESYSNSIEKFSETADSLASLYLARGNFESAVEIYDLLIDYQKKHASEKKFALAMAYNNRAVALYLQGSSTSSHAESIKILQKARSDFAQANELLSSNSDLKTPQLQNLNASRKVTSRNLEFVERELRRLPSDAQCGS